MKKSIESKEYKISNGIFVFQNQQDLVVFWNNHLLGNPLLKGKIEITNNTFIVARINWLGRFIQWILTDKKYNRQEIKGASKLGIKKQIKK